MTSLPVPEAARALGTSPESLRRWIRERGCPAVAGGPGRGRGYRVDPAAVRAWRAQSDIATATITELAGLALDFWRRGCSPAELGHRVAGIRDAQAAALLALFVGYAGTRMRAQGEPKELALLVEIARQGKSFTP